MDLIIVAGMPASGKSTIAASLSEAFHYPVLEKDNIKEGLFDVMGFENYAQKRRLDHASNEVLLRILEAMIKADSPLIVDNNFDTASAEKLCRLISDYRPNCVTVSLTGDPQVLYERYVKRDVLRQRHAGHVLQDHYPPLEGESSDYTMSREEFDEKFYGRGMGVFTCPGKRVEIDTTSPSGVSVSDLTAQVADLLGKDSPRPTINTR